MCYEFGKIINVQKFCYSIFKLEIRMKNREKGIHFIENTFIKIYEFINAYVSAM